MNRRILKWIVLALVLVGLIAACTPFIQSFFPNSKSRAELTRFHVADLKPGEYRFVKAGHPKGRHGMQWGYMLVRRWNGELNVWHVNVGEDSVVSMPEPHWSRADGAICKDFRPSDNFSVSEAGATIECWDEDSWPGWGELRWTIDGKALSEYRSDMSKVDGYDDGEDFIIGGQPEP